MTGSHALSHAFDITSKPVAPGLHPKAELLALFERLPPDATASDVAVLASLWAHSGPTGEAYPGQLRIAREARVSERTVKRSVKRLEQAGVFTRRVPHLATRIARKTTRYQLPLAPRPRFVRPVLVSVEASVIGGQIEQPPARLAPSVAECPTASEPPPPEQPVQVPLCPVVQVPPCHPKSQDEIIQTQSASAPVVPQAETLAARFTAPPASRAPAPVAAPPATRTNPKPDTAAALATLRAWVPPTKQLALGLTERPLESTGAASPEGRAREGLQGPLKGS